MLSEWWEGSRRRDEAGPKVSSGAYMSMLRE